MPKSLNVLISAGPTREAIDPVRYLSNHSSGKMGYALAAAAQKFANVTLVTGPTALPKPKGCKIIEVESAQDMLVAMQNHFAKNDVTIMVAAVADYRASKIATQKIKKTKNTLTLKLVKNPDILKTLGQRKKSRQLLVGFAAETENELAYGKKKLREKNLDWIAVNHVARTDIGFGSDQNEITLLNKDGKQIEIKKSSKATVAKRMLKAILNR